MIDHMGFRLGLHMCGKMSGLHCEWQGGRPLCPKASLYVLGKESSTMLNELDKADSHCCAIFACRKLFLYVAALNFRLYLPVT